MGSFGTPRGKPEDPLMENGKITPFRMQVLMDVAARVVKIMVTGAWHLTFEEMDIVLDHIRYGIEQSIRKNKEGEEADVPEDRRTEESNEVSP